MGHRHGISTAGGSVSINTFSDEWEEKKFHSMVKLRADEEFEARLPQNKGKDYSAVKSKVFERLMYVYISRELEGFNNYDG